MNIRQTITKSILLAALVFAGNWTVDTANAKVLFSVKGPFGTCNGSFTGLEASIHFDPNDLAGSTVQASIDAKTVTSGVGLRNHDLRSKEEWLNTDKFPRISFKSKKIEKSAAGYKAIGDLMLKGVTKPVEIAFTFTPNGNTGLFKGQFSIKREDFNVGKPGGSVGDMITLHLEVPVKK
jgi:polyisoprenoid-binding protein YceI